MCSEIPIHSSSPERPDKTGNKEGPETIGGTELTLRPRSIEEFKNELFKYNVGKNQAEALAAHEQTHFD